MTKPIRITKSSFIAGEVSPLIASEVESESYAGGMSLCQNYIVDINDGIKTAPGLQYIAGAYNTAEKSRLIPFTFNEEQAYGLEFGNLKMRIFKDGGLVGAPTEVVTPYAIADVADLDYTQSADTLYLTHGSYGLRTATRTSDTAWTISESALQMNGPYLVRDVGADEITIAITPSSSPATWTFDASAALFDDVLSGDCIRLGFPLAGDDAAIFWQWFLVDTVTSNILITANLQDGVSNIISGGYDVIGPQSVENPIFKNGITFWDDRSNANSTVTYKQSNGRMLLTDGATGSAFVEQAVLLRPNVKYVIHVTAPASTGATPTLNLQIGTTSLGVDVLASTPSIATNTFIPPSEIVYVSLNTSGSTDADTYEISGVQIYEYGDGLTTGAQYSTKEHGLGAFNSTRGFPKHCLIDGQRLHLANTATLPQTTWSSELGNYDGFAESTPSRSSDSFSFSPATDTINGINWIIEKGGLKVGTADAVWRVFAPSGGAIAPLDIAIEVDEAEGSLDLRPIVAHNAILMTPRGVSPVLEMVSSLEAKGFQTRDIASRAAHLFKNRRIVRWAFAKDPDSVIWVILDNGQLLGCTYHRRIINNGVQGVWAWFRRTCPWGAGYADVIVIPNSSDDNTDDVYFLVNRGTVGSPNYLLEQLNVRITPQEAAYGLSASGSPYDYRQLDSALTLDNPLVISGATQADPVVITSTGHTFLDGEEVRIQNVVGMTELNNNVYTVANKAANTLELNDDVGGTIDGTAFTAYISDGQARKMVLSVTGLSHLNGQVVTAIADGAARETLTVAAGAITLPISASFAHVGVPYTSLAETLDIEAFFPSGSSQGRTKSTTEVDVYFVDSRNCKVYPSNDTTNIQVIEFEDEVFGEDPPDLFTGVLQRDVKSKCGKQVRLVFMQDKPYPQHIRRVIIHVSYDV